MVLILIFFIHQVALAKISRESSVHSPFVLHFNGKRPVIRLNIV